MRILLFALIWCASSAHAQGSFTTAAEVRPIMDMTKANWVAVREFNGADYIYFTHIEAWRCGMDKVNFGINKDIADQEYPLEPCYEGEAVPNAIKLDGHLPYIVLPLRSITNVTIKITYDDGTIDGAKFDRNGVLIP